jgi:histidinol-phosphate aminotransferase
MAKTRRRGLLGYYRQFEGMSDPEISEELRGVADERRRSALARVEPLDLSGTTWFEFPHPDVVAAVTYAARRGINRYADPHALELRGELARRHGLEPERVVAGNGAAELLIAAARALLGPGDELLTPWPSYPLYPLMAKRAGGLPVPVPGRDPEALLEGLTGRTRVVVICNPNDPTGAYSSTAELRELIERLPEAVTVILDEALVDFVEAEPPAASLELLDDFPRLLVVRTFSKAYGLAGLRAGYALGGPGSERLLERLEPPLGVDALAQAGALEALRKCGPLVAGRRALVGVERRRLLDELGRRPVDAPRSEANVVWLAAPGVEGVELAGRLERFGVYVKPGAEFGASDHVRAQIQDAPATDRLLRALDGALGTG